MMKKGNVVALSVAGLCALFGIGVVTGGNLVAHNMVASSEPPAVEVVDVPYVPNNALAGKKLLVVATPAANREMVSAVQKQLSAHGAVITGQITLTPKFASVESARELTTLVENSTPQGMSLPRDEDRNAGRLAGNVVGNLAQRPTTLNDDALRSEMVEKLASGGFVTPDSFLGEADGAVIITGGGDAQAPESEAGARGITIAKFGVGLVQQKVMTIVGGAQGADKNNGPLAAILDWKTKDLEGVRGTDTPSGRATLVLRMATLLD